MSQAVEPIPKASDGTEGGKVKYQLWSDTEEDLLMEWLEKPGNYRKWKCSGKKNDGRGNATSGRTKKSMGEEIAKYLAEKGQRERSHKMVKDKITSLEKNWRIVSDWLGSTGAGVDDEKTMDRDGKLKSATIRAVVVQKCRLFDRLDMLCFERPSNNPAFVADSRDGTAGVSEILFAGPVASRAAEGVKEPEGNGQLAVPSREIPTNNENSSDEEESEEPRGRDTSNKKTKEKEPEKRGEKSAPLSFTKMMVECEKEKTERFKMQQETAKRKLEMDAQHQNRQLILQEKELEIRELEAKNHRLMLRLRAGNQAHDPDMD